MAQIEMDKCVKVLAEQAEEWGFGGKNQVLTALYKFLKRQKEIVLQLDEYSWDRGEFTKNQRQLILSFDYSDKGMKKIGQHIGFTNPERQMYIQKMGDLWLEYLFSEEGKALKFDRKPEERPENKNEESEPEETEDSVERLEFFF